MRVFRGAILAVSSMAALSAAQAGPASDREEIRALAARIKQLEAKVAKQEKDEKAAKLHGSNIVNAPGAPVKGDVVAPPPVFVSFKNGLFAETADHAYSFKIGGRIFVDGGGSTQPEGGKSGNVGFRRARLQIEGRAAHYWFYKFAYDFAGNNTPTTLGGSTTSPVGGIRDAYVGLQHPLLSTPFTKDPLYILVGNQFEPTTLEFVTSTNYTDFIERSLATDAFGANRHIGFAIGGYGSNWSAKGGVFSTAPDDKAEAPGFAVNYNPWAALPKIGSTWPATGGGNYVDITGRATYAPIKDDEHLIHLGAWGRYHRPNDSTSGNDDRVLALGSNLKSEENILNINLTGTPDLSCGTVGGAGVTVYGGSAVSGHCTKDVAYFGLEGVAAWGPASIQGEYMHAHYDRNPSAIALATFYGPSALPSFGLLQPQNSSANFDGFYAYGTYYLTGESRAESYNVKDTASAAFDQIKIKHPFSEGGPGAWELLLRYSGVDLNSGPYSGSAYSNLVGLGLQTGRLGLARAVASSSIVGGRQEDLTAGVNWYPDKGFRIMANWTRVMAASAPFDRPWLNGAHPNIFMVRTQVNW